MQAAMELDDRQKAAMLAARRRLLADMGALMRQRSRIVELLSLAAPANPSMDTLAGNSTLQVCVLLNPLKLRGETANLAATVSGGAVHVAVGTAWPTTPR